MFGVCPVYMSCTFLIYRCGVRGRTWAFPVSGSLEFFVSWLWLKLNENPKDKKCLKV